MTDRPIIFSAPMVLALLAGRKTMTRRLAWRRDQKWGDARPIVGSERDYMIPTTWQRVKSGDRLWVRENLTRRRGNFLGIPQNVIEAHYAADDEDVVNEHEFNLLPWWKGKGGLPSIHMPRRVSRLTLVVTATKIERVQAISETDAKAEGVE